MGANNSSQTISLRAAEAKKVQQDERIPDERTMGSPDPSMGITMGRNEKN